MASALNRRADPQGVNQFFDISLNLQPKAVGIQVVLMVVLSIITIVMFNVLRHRNELIYEPKLKYHPYNKKPPVISDSFFGWIHPILNNHEPELLDQIGLDAVTFLRFLHLMRWLLSFTALMVCGALIPLDLLYTISIKPPQYDILSAMTIRDVHGTRLYAHIIATYLIAFLLMFLVLHHWKHIYNLRYLWLTSPEYQRLLYARNLCVTDIPQQCQSVKKIYKIFEGLQLPYSITSVHIGRRVGDLPELIKKHNDAVTELEQVMAKYTGNSRPTIFIGGCCGLGGTRKDAINYYTSKLKNTEAAVQQYRAQMDMHTLESYGFVSMAAIPFAHAVAYDLRGKHPKGLSINLAPNPKDIIWANFGRLRGERILRQISGFIIMQIFCVLSLVPLFPIASLANIDAFVVSGYLPFLKTWSNSSPLTFAIVSGILPPAVSSIFSYFLPLLMRWLSKYMGATTQSSLDRMVIARHFAFLFVSQLIIFTFIGVIFNSIEDIIINIRKQGASLKIVIDNLDKLPAKITRTYVDQASFWLKWLPMQAFLLIFDMAQFFDLIWVSLRRRLSGLTPRFIRENTKPPPFDYAVTYSSLLFMGAVGILFAPLAPLVSLAAAIIFWLCSWIYKYQLIFRYITHIESGGRCWNVVVNRLLFTAMFMQIVMILTIGLQVEFQSLQFVASTPPLLLLMIFKHYLKVRFSRDFQYYLPRHEEASQTVIHSDDPHISGNKLEQRYVHPALNSELFKPMVHSHLMSSLRQLYKRKRTLSRGEGVLIRGINEKSNKVTKLEGVDFTLVPEDQLEYDPMLYKRDREEVDCDFDSVQSTLSFGDSIPCLGQRANSNMDQGLGNKYALPDPPPFAVHPHRSISRPPDLGPNLSIPSYRTAEARRLDQARKKEG